MTPHANRDFRCISVEVRQAVKPRNHAFFEPGRDPRPIVIMTSNRSFEPETSFLNLAMDTSLNNGGQSDVGGSMHGLSGCAKNAIAGGGSRKYQSSRLIAESSFTHISCRHPTVGAVRLVEAECNTQTRLSPGGMVPRGGPNPACKLSVSWEMCQERNELQPKTL